MGDCILTRGGGSQSSITIASNSPLINSIIFNSNTNNTIYADFIKSSTEKKRISFKTDNTINYYDSTDGGSNWNLISSWGYKGIDKSNVLSSGESGASNVAYSVVYTATEDAFAIVYTKNMRNHACRVYIDDTNMYTKDQDTYNNGLTPLSLPLKKGQKLSLTCDLDDWGNSKAKYIVYGVK